MYYRTRTEAQKTSDSLRNICTICGAKDREGHDLAVHEVFAYETWGMRSVIREMRPFVKSWAEGTHRLPTPAEFLAKREELYTKSIVEAPAPAAEEVTDGIYVLHGQYVKVVTSPTTGRSYAKQWDVQDHSWTYVGRTPFRHLDQSKKVTAEQASEFGSLYGQCVFCGRTLTDERSISVGYGPTCAAHNGLPWGEVTLEAPLFQ